MLTSGSRCLPGTPLNHTQHYEYKSILQTKEWKGLWIVVVVLFCLFVVFFLLLFCFFKLQLLAEILHFEKCNSK